MESRSRSFGETTRIIANYEPNWMNCSSKLSTVTVATPEANAISPDPAIRKAAGTSDVTLPCDVTPTNSSNWSTNSIGGDLIDEATRRGRVRLRPNRGFPCHLALRRDPP
jgi:hypothetical protein